MESDHKTTQILFKQLDKRKRALHAKDKSHFVDEMCNMFRDAIKNTAHPYRCQIKKEIEKNKQAKKHGRKDKKKKRRNKGRKTEKRYTSLRPAVKRKTPRVTPWVSRDEWLKETDRFYASRAWKEVRYFVLQRDGATCACCGARASDGVCMWVDHIKPRSVYPELQLDPENMRVLCDDCNQGKSNYYDDDWRVKMA